MINNFEALLEMARWNLPRKAKIDNLKESVDIKLSDEFGKTFPQLGQLLSLATVKEFTANDERYRFYQWLDKNGEPIIWLANMELKKGKIREDEYPVSADEISYEHLLLLQNMGGIEKTWNECEEEDFLTWAKNFHFTLQHSYRFKDQERVYSEDSWVFEEVDENKQLPIKDLICFSEEANGNLTFYNKTDSSVYLLLGDHCFEYVEELDGHPEYSFYTIKEINTFVEYVELLASQAFNCIKV